MGCVRRRYPRRGARNTAFSKKTTVSLGVIHTSLPPESTPQDGSVECRLQPPISPRPEPLRRRHPGSHHRRMAAAKLLQDRIVLKPKGGELIQFRLRGRRGIPVIDLGLLLLLDQHSLRVLDPP